MEKQSQNNYIAEETEKISVIICVYNVCDYIAECLDSVLTQTWSNLEILVIDDGSSDEGGKICDSYAEKDGRIRVIHQDNQGLSAARNAGTEASTGAYLSYLDGDDVLHPEFFSFLYQDLKANGADVSVGDFRVFETKDAFDGNRIVKKPAKILTGKEAAERIIKDHEPRMIPACGKLYDRKLKELLKYPVGKIHEDEFTTYKVLYAAEKAAVSNTKLYGIRKRPGSITAEYNPRRLDKLEALKECIAWCEEQNEEALTKYAKIRYILNLQISWYNIHTRMEGAKTLEQQIVKEHKQAAGKYWSEVSSCAKFSEKCAVRAFLMSPKIYLFFAKIYRIFVKERG